VPLPAPGAPSRINRMFFPLEELSLSRILSRSFISND